MNSKHLVLCVTFLFGLSACKCNQQPVAPKAELVTPLSRDTAAETPPASPAKGPCTNLPVGEMEALAVWKMKNGAELVVCALGEIITRRENSFSGWINIYQRSNDELKPFIAEVDSEMPSEFFNFTIEKIDDAQIRVTRLMHNGGEVPVSRRTLDCADSACQFGPESCVPYAKPAVDEEAIRRVQKVVAGGAFDEAEYYDITINKLIRSGLAGDKRSLRLIFDTSEEKLKVDGASAEVLGDGKRFLSKLKELSCL